MLGWAVGFLVAAIILAFMGLTAAASTFALMAQVLFWVFVLGFAISLMMHFSRGRA